VSFEADGNGILARRSNEPGWAVLMWGMLDPRYGLDGTGVDGPVETLRFQADGSTLSAAALRAALPAGQWLPGDATANSLAGDAQRNSIWGLAGDDTLSGGDGDDWLYGGEGDDDVSGNAGTDWLEDYVGGADTYRWQRGDGTDYLIDQGADGDADQIVFGAGVAVADLAVSREGDDLFFNVSGADGGGLRVLGWFNAGAQARIASIHFADGTTWSADDAEAQIALPAPALRLGDRAAMQAGDGRRGTRGRVEGDLLALADAVAGFVGEADTLDLAHAQPAPGLLRWFEEPLLAASV
jgi:Ca2+-binding RTX toxin-like protein